MLSEGFDAAGSPDSDTRTKLFAQLAQLAQSNRQRLQANLSQLAADDCLWRVSYPMNEARGKVAAIKMIWEPLIDAFPDLERRDVIFVAGRYQGKSMIASLGHYCGTMRQNWLGIPATGKTIYLRYGEVWQVDNNGHVQSAYLLWDVLDVMRQAGHWPLPASRGVETMWPAPLTVDGIRLSPSDHEVGRHSIEQTLRMHKTLLEFDDRNALSRQALIAMPQREHWHPKMMWYGPAGIGTTRGLEGFVDGHQLPFRKTFHRPQGTYEEVMAERSRHGAGHYIRIGDGPYSVTGGWPSVYAMHNGNELGGIVATHKPVFMRVMDFYLHHEGLIRENWVPIDMLHVFAQMGFTPLDSLTATRQR